VASGSGRRSCRCRTSWPARLRKDERQVLAGGGAECVRLSGEAPLQVERAGRPRRASLRDASRTSDGIALRRWTCRNGFSGPAWASVTWAAPDGTLRSQLDARSVRRARTAAGWQRARVACGAYCRQRPARQGFLSDVEDERGHERDGSAVLSRAPMRVARPHWWLEIYASSRTKKDERRAVEVRGLGGRPNGRGSAIRRVRRPADSTGPIPGRPSSASTASISYSRDFCR